MTTKLRGLSVTSAIIKRCFDIVFAALGLIITSPLILLAFIAASIETRSNGFFIQKRVGLHGNFFNVIKIKTMKKITGVDTNITASNDIRISKTGALFRKTKIDELPQLWNVLLGQMSFVGPRPDVAGYADRLKGDDRIILSIRPGITGPASLKYKHEEYLLSQQPQPKNYNDQVIWPDKVKINREYIENYTFKKDICYIFKTVLS